MKNANIRADFHAKSRRETDPFSSKPITMVRTKRARTSSITAAPKTVRVSTVPISPHSAKTRILIPTLVAVKAAPIKRATAVLSPIRIPIIKPNIKGKITPKIATNPACFPTLIKLSMSVSSPTSNRRKAAPISAKIRKNSSSGSMNAKRLRPIPASNSPTTSG